MAAQTTVLNGNDFLLKLGGNTIGGGMDAELSIEQALEDVTNDTAPNWRKLLESTRQWGLTFSSMYLEDSEEINGEDLAITVGGVALKGLTQASLRISVATSDVVNTTTGYDRTVAPKTRSVTLDVEFDYYDPAGTGAGGYETLLKQVLGEEAGGVAVALAFGASGGFSGNAKPANVNISKTQGSHVTGSLTLEFSGVVTNATTDTDTGFTALLTALFGAGAVSSVTALLGTSVADNTEYTGTAYPTEITISIPYVGRVDVSGTLTGSGALTRQKTT